MSAIDALVRAEDYNNIRSKVVGVLGSGSADFGWGQPTASSAVVTGIPSGTATRIGLPEYAALATDITNAHRHIFGSDPALPSPTEHALVKFNTTTEPINRFNTIADTIVNNRFTAAGTRLKVEEKGTITATWPSATYGSFWNSQLNCLVRIQFTTATQARHFFNSGGTLRFFSSRTGGTSGRAQNNSWTNLLANSGTVLFGGNTPSTDTAPSDGGNYYRLTSDFQVFHSNTATSPYSTNLYRISAKAIDLDFTPNNQNGISRRIDFYVEWIDNYVDPGDDPFDATDPGDEVDGTILLKVDSGEATGALVPSGIFTVESPQVAVGAIQQVGNTSRVTPNAFIPVNQPFNPVNAPPSTVNAPDPTVNAPDPTVNVPPPPPPPTCPTYANQVVTGSLTGGTVWGSNPYTDDSDFNRAAVHAGLIAVGQTATIRKQTAGYLYTFTGTTANGITTNDWTSGWCGVNITLA